MSGPTMVGDEVHPEARHRALLPSTVCFAVSNRSRDENSSSWALRRAAPSDRFGRRSTSPGPAPVPLHPTSPRYGPKVGLSPPQTLLAAPLAAAAPEPILVADNEAKGEPMPETSGVETVRFSVEQSTGSDRGFGAFVSRHGLASYFALAYGLSWLAWLPYILSQDGLGILDISFPKILGDTQLAGILFGAYLGPLGAAFIVTAVSEGRPGLRRWVGRLLRWRVGWRWYALALVGVPALLVAGTLAVSLGAAAGLRFPPLELLLVYLPFLSLQMVTTGLAEEPGWRDFALVRHQRLHGPLLGTLILGVLWAGWHLPLFLTDWGRGNGGANPSNILSFVLFCLLFSVVITWVFNKTRG